MPGDIPTFDDFFQVARKEWRLRNPKISATEIDREGSDSNIIVGVSAAMATEIMRQVTLFYRQFFLDTAIGKDLDKLIADRYGILRNPAATSKVEVTFSRTSTTGGAGSIPIGTRLSSTDGKEYLTLEVATFAAADLERTGIDAESVLAGRATHVNVNTLTKILDTIFDSSITVKNPLESSGGVDEETDEKFRERARTFFTTARRGTLAAIEFGAKTVAGVKLATALELTNENNKPAQVVECYVSDQDDTSNSALLTSVTNALESYRAAGICVSVKGGVVVMQSVTMKLKFVSGTDSVKLSSDVRAAIVAHINALKIGDGISVGTLYEADLLRLARAVNGVVIENNGVIIPVGDVIPIRGTFLRTRPDLVTFI